MARSNCSADRMEVPSVSPVRWMRPHRTQEMAGPLETSGHHVEVAKGTVVTTQALHGKDGNWLIDPPDFTIAPSGGDIDGATLSANLDLTNVTIRSDQGTVNANGSGDINVNDTVAWSKGTTLTLSAVHDININSPIGNGLVDGNTDNGSTINLIADSGGACVTGAGATACGTVNFNPFNGETHPGRAHQHLLQSAGQQWRNSDIHKLPVGQLQQLYLRADG